MKFLKIHPLLVFTFMTMGCTSVINLEPTDRRPVKSIYIEDAAEVALLQQEMGIEIKYVDNNTLYFYADNQKTISDLENLGYKINTANAMQTSFKLVKLISKDNSPLTLEKNETVRKGLQDYGVKVLKREKGYWAVYGSLGNLSIIRELGYKIQSLETEVKPKYIEVRVPTSEDVQKVNEMNVDVYGYSTQGESYIVSGRAFDYQIDLLESAGYQIIKQN